jgi:hypothetical protein
MTDPSKDGILDRIDRKIAEMAEQYLNKIKYDLKSDVGDELFVLTLLKSSYLSKTANCSNCLDEFYEDRIYSKILTLLSR